jgi:hypothetical protein
MVCRLSKECLVPHPLVAVAVVIVLVFTGVDSCHRRHGHPHRRCHLPLYIAAAAVSVNH